MIVQLQSRRYYIVLVAFLFWENNEGSKLMNNTAYLSYMVVLRMLGVKTNDEQLEKVFENTKDIDLEIIKSAKQMGLKVKITKFKRKIIEKLTVPVIAECRDGNYILILNK